MAQRYSDVQCRGQRLLPRNRGRVAVEATLTAEAGPARLPAVDEDGDTVAGAQRDPGVLAFLEDSAFRNLCKLLILLEFI